MKGEWAGVRSAKSGEWEVVGLLGLYCPGGAGGFTVLDCQAPEPSSEANSLLPALLSLLRGSILPLPCDEGQSQSALATQPVGGGHSA